jgi:hypothetical protein
VVVIRNYFDWILGLNYNWWYGACGMKLPSLWFLMIPAIFIGGFLVWVGYQGAGVVVILSMFGFWILPEIIFLKKP